MRKSLKEAQIARVRDLKNSGETLEALAARFNVSKSTIWNYVKPKAPPPVPARPVKKPNAPATPSSAAPGAEEELPTPEDLRRSLAGQVRALRADVDGAETPAQRATAHRLLTTATQLLSRVTPPDPTVAPAGMTIVPTDELEALADQGERRLLKLLDAIFAGDAR